MLPTIYWRLNLVSLCSYLYCLEFIPRIPTDHLLAIISPSPVSFIVRPIFSDKKLPPFLWGGGHYMCTNPLRSTILPTPKLVRVRPSRGTRLYLHEGIEGFPRVMLLLLLLRLMAVNGVSIVISSVSGKHRDILLTLEGVLAQIAVPSWSVGRHY